MEFSQGFLRYKVTFFWNHIHKNTVVANQSHVSILPLLLFHQSNHTHTHTQTRLKKKLLARFHVPQPPRVIKAGGS